MKRTDLGELHAQIGAPSFEDDLKQLDEFNRQENPQLC
jgi:hypothetical protein